jgi:hypothetical protein
MTTQPPAPNSPCTQLAHRGRAAPADRRRTSRHGIAALGHRIAALLIKSDRSRPGAPRGEGGSTS